MVSVRLRKLNPKNCLENADQKLAARARKMKPETLLFWLINEIIFPAEVARFHRTKIKTKKKNACVRFSLGLFGEYFLLVSKNMTNIRKNMTDIHIDLTSGR